MFLSGGRTKVGARLSLIRAPHAELVIATVTDSCASAVFFFWCLSGNEDCGLPMTLLLSKHVNELYAVVGLTV